LSEPTAGGLKVAVEDGKLKILKEGRARKFVNKVEQITFSGPYSANSGQTVLYVTERCVFQLTPEGLELIETAPGVDVERDILAHMDSGRSSNNRWRWTRASSSPKR